MLRFVVKQLRVRLYEAATQGPPAATCASPAPPRNIVLHTQHHGAAAHRRRQVGRAGSWRRRRGWRPRPTWRACAAWASSTWPRCGCGWTAPCGRGRRRTSWRASTPASAPPCSTSARCRWPAARARPAEFARRLPSAAAPGSKRRAAAPVRSASACRPGVRPERPRPPQRHALPRRLRTDARTMWLAHAVYSSVRLPPALACRGEANRRNSCSKSISVAAGRVPRHGGQVRCRGRLLQRGEPAPAVRRAGAPAGAPARGAQRAHTRSSARASLQRTAALLRRMLAAWGGGVSCPPFLNLISYGGAGCVGMKAGEGLVTTGGRGSCVSCVSRLHGGTLCGSEPALHL